MALLLLGFLGLGAAQSPWEPRRLNAPCAASGQLCSSRCCDRFESCFEEAGSVSLCRGFCVPEEGRSCRTPYAHPLGQARKTEQWPDLAAVCDAGTALVQPQAFQEKYNGSCAEFCRAAGQVIHQPLMFAVSGGPGYGEMRSCMGDKEGKHSARFIELCKDHQWEKVKQILSEQPALVNCEVDGRWSALHYAARAGNPQMVEFLLSKSADATSFAGDGKSPLEVAKGHDVRSMLMKSCFLSPATAIFEHYDSSGTGVIDSMELGWVIKAVKPNLTDMEIQQIFACVDTNKNGEIDFVEFVMWLFAGQGKSMAQEILATAYQLSSSGVGKQALRLKHVLALRAGLDPHVYLYPDFAPMPKMAHHPPRDEKPQTCVEYVQQMLPQLPGIPMIEETLAEVQRLADLRVETSQGQRIQHPEMVCAIVIWTFDTVLVDADTPYTKEQTFQYQVNKFIDKRDSEFFYVGRGFFYYLMTALEKLPPAGGVVYQGIPGKDVATAREALVEGTTVTWRCFTTALQLWGSMVTYDRGLVLQITLLPESRGKGSLFESKGRDISKLSAFSGSSEVLLLPNIRMRVGWGAQDAGAATSPWVCASGLALPSSRFSVQSFYPEVQRKGLTVIELTELEEDTATTLNAEDFDCLAQKPERLPGSEMQESSEEPGARALRGWETSEQPVEVGKSSTSTSEGTSAVSVKKPSVSTLEAYVNLVTVIIGAGILALPQLPARGGWVLCPLLLILCGFAVHESALQLWKGFMADHAIPVSTYEDLGEAAFGVPGRAITTVVVNAFLLGICSAYCALIGMQLQTVSNNAIHSRAWLLIMYPVFVCLALLPNLSVLSKLVPVGMVAALATAVCIIAKAMIDVEHWSDWSEEAELHAAWPAQWPALGAVLATCLGAFTLAPVSPPLIQDMAKPERFPRALSCALLTCAILYIAVMLCGYYGYGNFIQENVVANMHLFPASSEEALRPASTWTGSSAEWLAPVVSVMVLTNIMLSMPLLAMAVFYSVQSFKYTAPYVPPGSWANWAMRVALITGVDAVALAVPRFTVVFAFFSAVTSPFVSLVLPICFAGAILKDKPRVLRRAWHVLIVIVGALCLIFGVYTAVMDMVHG
ncbi:unnamed protein product [Effrenium voratum]|nr:unnamed protein product [Effrenium voratum]